MAYKRKTYTCDFCGKRFYHEQDPYDYIYPIPIKGKKGQTPNNRVGGRACPNCAPEQRELQKKMGLVVEINYDVGWNRKEDGNAST